MNFSRSLVRQNPKTQQALNQPYVYGLVVFGFNPKRLSSAHKGDHWDYKHLMENSEKMQIQTQRPHQAQNSPSLQLLPS
jgi:hypothetical protein